MKGKPQFLSYSISYVIWSIWSLVGGEILPPRFIPAFIFDFVIKLIIWIGPPVWALWKNDHTWYIRPTVAMRGDFPYLPTVIGVCLTAVFLHTVHILTVGIQTWGIMLPLYVMISLSAAVMEEITFRGFYFNKLAPIYGVSKAALLSGLLFALYHFPEFLFGRNLESLFGMRFWLITLMGLFFALAFARWKHIGMTIVIHFIWNLLCFWFALA